MPIAPNVPIGTATAPRHHLARESKVTKGAFGAGATGAEESKEPLVPIAPNGAATAPGALQSSVVPKIKLNHVHLLCIKESFNPIVHEKSKLLCLSKDFIPRYTIS